MEEATPKLTVSPTVCITESMTKTISLRLDEMLLYAVDVAGEVEHKGRSEVVREAVELWLRRRTLTEKVRRHREGYIRRPVTRDEFAPVLGAQTWPK
jgi:Arc/MetJ-type ribon-helix-helix transcriptional regulator